MKENKNRPPVNTLVSHDQFTSEDRHTDTLDAHHSTSLVTDVLYVAEVRVADKTMMFLIMVVEGEQQSCNGAVLVVFLSYWSARAALHLSLVPFLLKSESRLLRCSVVDVDVAAVDAQSSRSS